MLAGDRLVDNQYEPIPIETVEEGVLQGYSTALNLFIRWKHGELGWHDPETGQHIVRYGDLLDMAKSESESRSRAEAQRNAAQDRIRELEAELVRRDTAG